MTKMETDGLLRHRSFVWEMIARRLVDVVKERDLWVHLYRTPPDSNNSTKMEVGVEECFHIEFEYNESNCVAHSLFPS